MIPARPLVAALVLAALAACSSDPTRGYAFGGAFDEEVTTVAVPVFDNATFVPGVERELTDAIIKRIQAQTPWRVASLGRADTTLSGAVVGVDQRSLSVVPETGFTQEQAVRVTVRFTWRDNRTGEDLVAVDGFSAAATFTPARGTSGEPGERPELGRRDAIDELAEAIVERLRSRW
ncbi:MAG: LptE family protein [Planctomycetota bacterium]